MSIKKQFISGVFFTALTKYLGIIVSLVITGVLSRILRPSDFGLIAIVSVLITFFNLLAEMGIGPAVVQRQDLSKRDYQELFFFTIVVGVVLSLLFIIAAPCIASFYEEDRLVLLCRLLAFGIVLNCVNIIPNALLLKERKFKFIMYRQLLVQLLSGGVGIICALNGLGVWALVIYTLCSGLFVFCFNYFKNPLGISFFSKQTLQKISKFATYQFLFGFINFFSRNADNLLIGKYISPSALGYYDKSYRLMMIPIENLTHVFSPVIQPVLYEYQDDKVKIFSVYSKLVSILALIGFPLSVFLHFSASELIFIVFGSQWKASVPVFEILALSAGIQIVLSSSGSIFQVANDTKRLFVSGFLSAIVMVSSILVGVLVFKDLEKLAWMLVLAFAFNFFQCYFILIKKVLEQSLSDFFRLLYWPVFVAVCFYITGSMFAPYLIHYNLWMSLFLKIFIAVVIWGILAGRQIIDVYRGMRA
ncbi:lipopolysaccharide biosynthesis protein [Flavobacterium daejeonense]|uniref:lipopolysaccharide biosynthesis protein n=1 Tax=Flavobacterium daejeonense TaxID=350893 RepID=UPI00047ED861|nr:lipopolysaccharide biosynthesis protein [Flavobacterium daejeonense]